MVQTEPTYDVVAISDLVQRDHGRRGRRFSPEQREHNRAVIAKRTLHGVRPARIAEELGISFQQVAYDLRIVVTRWQESAKADIDKHRGMELARLDELETEAWAAWEASKGTSRIDTFEMAVESDRQGQQKSVPGKRTVREEKQTGDPRFLDQVFKCIDRRIRLLGIDAPSKDDGVMVTSRIGVSIGTNDDRTARIAAVAALFLGPGDAGGHASRVTDRPDLRQPVDSGETTPEASGILDVAYRER